MNRDANGVVGTSRSEPRPFVLQVKSPFWITIFGMKLESIGEVIAIRTLFLANDPSQQVVVKMGQPCPLPDALGDDHYCPYEIRGAGTERLFYAAGTDAFQALELGLKNIGVHLRVLNKQLDHQLRWEGDEQGGLGFPETVGEGEL
jgi:hypothetical protein